MSIHSIIQFLVVIEESRTESQVIAEFENLLRIYKFDYYNLLRQSRQTESSAVSVLACRWPEGWLDTYLQKKYMLIDPTVRHLWRAQRSFRFSDALDALKGDPHRKRMERMMADARDFGLADGYIFPIHGRGGLLGSLMLGGRAIDLSPVEKTLFETAARSIFWRLLVLAHRTAELEQVAAGDVQITRREMEVLHYLAEGLTSNEISRQLNISNHTVDWYMNGIQAKLNAKNRQHTVALALRMGLVS